MKKFLLLSCSLILISLNSVQAQSKSDKTQNNTGLSDFYIEMVSTNLPDFPCMTCSSTPISLEEHVLQVKNWIINNSTTYFNLLANKNTVETLTLFDIKNYEVEKYGRAKIALGSWFTYMTMQLSINENFPIVTDLKNSLFGKSQGTIYLFLIHQNDLNFYFKNI